GFVSAKNWALLEPSGARLAADPTEVRVREARRVLEAVAEHAVEADVRGPDQRDGDRPGRRAYGDPRCREERGPHERVGRVVGGRAHARTGEVGEERDVGHEEERGEDAPARVEARVGSGREQEEQGALEAEEEARGAVDGAFDGHRGGDLAFRPKGRRGEGGTRPR